VVKAPTAEDRLEAAQKLRARLHRLSPSKPLRNAADAAAFVRERRIVTETGHTGVPVLAHAIAGRELAGSWMASPEVHRIYDLIEDLSNHDLCFVSLLDAKVTIIEPSLAPAVHRIATDPERVERLLGGLPPPAARLYARVQAEGDVRMDQTGLSTKEGRVARLRLERHLLVVGQGIHTDRGSHTVALRPWSESRLARRLEDAPLPSPPDAMDLLLETAVTAAVVVPETQARKWFDFAAERLDRLVDAGRIERLVIAPRLRWLLQAPAPPR
jgi:hypothetical protein